MKVKIGNRKFLFFKIILSVIFILCASSYAIFNLFFLPAGYHLALGIRVTPASELDIFTFGSTRWTSFMLAKYAKNKCDSATFQHGVFKNGRNLALSTLAYLYGEVETDKNAALELFIDRLKICDVNSPGELDVARTPFTPLQESIIFRHPILVKLLLDAGARTDLTMPKIGRKTDGMNAIELATLFMQSKKLNESESRVANEIYLLIKMHEDGKENDAGVAEKKLRR